MNFKQLQLAYGTEAARIGRYYSNKFKGRAIEILKELAKKYPIESLTMGMGVWTLDGGKFKAHEPGWEEFFELEVNELVDWADSGRKAFDPVGVTIEDKKLLIELKEILDTLTYDSNLTIFDWQKKP